MATFQAIGLNLAIGSGVLATSILMFTAAVHFEWNDMLAPRTYARPRTVIKNVLQGPYYGISWIPWTLSLSFQDMLEGLPGTGTRRNGWSGKRLNCNLDGIVVIKFHALCLRVAIFSSLLCICVILPVNWTAECDSAISGVDMCTNITHLTNFEQTTLAHIPPLDYVASVDVDMEDSELGFASTHMVDSLRRHFLTSPGPGTSWRLYVIVLVACAIFIYSCLLIWNEWIENLALRRVFYLEHDHFQERKAELEYLATLSDPELEFQSKRPPFIPHPEIRDTVPNISLYSVLYKLPDYFFSTAASPSTSLLDRQLASTVDFFDKCIPNQPGYSSSVAAVTILPDASQVAQAWRKWYKCANRLRRLRFIRSRIREVQKDLEQSIEKKEEEELIFQENLNRLESPDESDGSGPIMNRNKSENTNISGTERTCSEIPSDREVLFNTSPLESILSRASGTPSPRHRKDLTLLPTVKELDNVLWDPPPDGLLQEAKSNISTPGIDVESEVPDRVCNMNDVAQSSKEIHTCHQVPVEFPSFSDTASDLEAQGSSESMAEIADDFASKPLASEVFIPYIDTRRSPSTDTCDTREPRLRFSSTELRKSPESVGLAEEGKLALFLSEDGMEQLSAYCREFSQSSAGCCIYGCDYRRLANADLETLKELEEEAEDMVEEANQALIEARASVNKNALDIESGASHDSLIAIRKLTQRSLLHDTENNVLDAEVKHDMAVGYHKDSSGIGNGSQSDRHSFESCQVDPESGSSEQKWKMAGHIANESRKVHVPRGTQALIHPMSSGKWHFSPGDSFLRGLREMTQPQLSESMPKKKIKLVGAVVDHHIYAVVTFTSRQAAISARQCMADGSGLGRWQEVEDLPIPPLADSAPWDICLCRGCCRPVTLTINDSQKRCRKNITWLFLVLFCFLYTIPLSLTSNLLTADQLATWFPGLGIQTQLSGILTGLLYTIFFSVCPFIFKTFANFGSSATSQHQAELRAIRYYWIFILVTAFTGSSLATMITSGLYSGLNLGASAQEVLRQVAKAIPTQISATWLNWILVRFLFTIPTLYLFQGNTFLFSMLGMDCCARCTRGGGPGGPLPFRIFVDSGAVFLCIVALAPACPLVAPAGMLYYLAMTPLLRWLLIFVHRPLHDGGGHRWPLIHDILVSSMIVAQVLLTTMMVLKTAYGPALLAALSIVPTLMFSHIAKDRFLRCYNDAGLVQTSQLDGWDVSKATSNADREEFRKWLVDCHKASYIPICLAGMDSFLTAEPAVVIPIERDSTVAGSLELKADFMRKRRRTTSQESMHAQRSRIDTLDSAFASVNSSSSQRCALFRRVPHPATPFFSGTPRSFTPVNRSRSST